MKRYKVKFTDPETDKHEATRSYDENELVLALNKLNNWLLLYNQQGLSLDMNGLEGYPECPLPSWEYIVYDRKKIAEVKGSS